ncbi:hypothetical protein OpiT1DRAFT_05430 [Opitutaceae bacterium TAV1]|nr:hypothetical protein OpiT1DRAFT_05430 [Opitutaceae bacterium TAV1]
MQDAAEFLRQDAVMTKEEKRRLLRRLAYSPRSTPKERIQAIETDNRMAGHNEPDEVNVNASSVLVSLLRSEGGAANG